MTLSNAQKCAEVLTSSCCFLDSLFFRCLCGVGYFIMATSVVLVSLHMPRRLECETLLDLLLY
jgi:hypothetical protein